MNTGIKKAGELTTRYWNNIFFPNFKLTVFRNTHETFEKTKKLMFKTTCDVGKTDIKSYVKALYGVHVNKVNTINVQGRLKGSVKGIGKKAKRQGTFKTSDYKKAIITISEPTQIQPLKR
ncbi:hypothetical protein DLAC_11677 [Tieghemostelium lacteum]|uniref:Large ribosomal subunit protein uL23m n=1 Tax=Tieghemostelium lacteum TaxID=361077 RepID=A0A151ZE20_TIELA|nr:hypothetical protein DLAC_11677 [Tieghemostelium lacteum]|eukprot:KYQ92175.1 hypothetical protein DLAC_11677 [Tieghemostelium lacteum]